MPPTLLLSLQKGIVGAAVVEPEQLADCPLEIADISITDLFNLDELQALQNAFSVATNVASLMTKPDGTPITQPSNFCRLCSEIIRKTEKGCANCFNSDAVMGKHQPDGPTVQRCLSAGLWDAGASITVAGKHVANWLIGQVRNEQIREEELMTYAREIGADEDEFREALHQVPVMSLEQFQSVARLAFLLANELSTKAYQNLQQARLMAERGRTEEAMLRSEKLAAVGRMAATIAHEMNNPLAAVMNSLFLARSCPDLPDSAHQYLELADAELRRMAHITRQALAFYREPSAPTTFPACELLEAVTELLKSKIKARHVDVQLECNPELMLTGIFGELRQVLSNLLTNSLDAVDENGKVILRASVSPLNRQHVRITISDNGKGISASALSHIFEPFYSTKGPHGTGLGLWVSKQIIEKHQGSIRVHSRQNGRRKGTTFSISVAAATSDSAADTCNALAS